MEVFFDMGQKKSSLLKNVKSRHLLELKEYAEQVDTRGRKNTPGKGNRKGKGLTSGYTFCV